MLCFLFLYCHLDSLEIQNKSRSNYPSPSLYLSSSKYFSHVSFYEGQGLGWNTTNILTAAFLNADMEDLKAFVKDSGSAEDNDLAHWDLNYWSERLRESKYDMDEVLSLQKYISMFFLLRFDRFLISLLWELFRLHFLAFLLLTLIQYIFDEQNCSAWNKVWTYCTS